MTAADGHTQAAATEAAAAALLAAFGRAWGSLAPPPPLSIAQWAETYRELSPEESALPGRYDLENAPALRGILAAISDPKTRKCVVQKAAQVAYTSGIICNVIGYHIHWRPSVQVAMFPREKSAKDFASEKFEPMVRATKVLADRINLRSRMAGQGTTRRHFVGGLLKLVASNSPSDVKSTSGRVGIVEEPDDANRDVGGQGNSIVLLAERTKTYAPEDLQLIGGTPTAVQTSLIVREMASTDQRVFMVECHHCHERHAPAWANVHIPGDKLSDEEIALPPAELDRMWPRRDVYGRAQWERAQYGCPHCGALWTDHERCDNIRRAAREAPLHGWVPQAQSEVPGFYLPEFLSVFAGSYIPELAKKYLLARHEFDRGEPEKMVAFWNSSLGLPWEYKGELPEEDELRQRAEPYAEWSAPAAALVPLLYVDVQADRLACTVWVVGRGEEMWLAYWGELPGRTVVSHQGAWVELEALMQHTTRHASGADLQIAAVGIDSGDGQTSEAVYDFVRRHNRSTRPVYATKGASDAIGRVEIWTRPKDIDPNARATKATRSGVRVSIIGAAKAKDLVLGWAQEGGRVRLKGTGPGRMHWYDGVRDDFFEQLLGEMKVPSRANPRVRAWVPRTDRRHEVLDCTVGALWMSRQLRLHLKRPVDWLAIEGHVRQASLLAEQLPLVQDDDGADEADAPAGADHVPGLAPAQASAQTDTEQPARTVPPVLATTPPAQQAAPAARATYLQHAMKLRRTRR